MAGARLKTHDTQLHDIQTSLRQARAELGELAKTTGIRKLTQISSVLDSTSAKVGELAGRVEQLETNDVTYRRLLDDQSKRINLLETNLAKVISLLEQAPFSSSVAPARGAPVVFDESAAVLDLPKISHNGVLDWTIEHFTQIRADAVTGRRLSVYSPVFYSAPQGYKMKLRLYPNGDGIGRGRHISLFFTIVKGEYDDSLRWPFQKKVTFCLMDQSGRGQHIVESFIPDPNSSSFQKPRSDVNVASGCPLFISLERLGDRSNYILGDTLIIKASVDGDSHLARSF